MDEVFKKKIKGIITDPFFLVSIVLAFTGSMFITQSDDIHTLYGISMLIMAMILLITSWLKGISEDVIKIKKKMEEKNDE